MSTQAAGASVARGEIGNFFGIPVVTNDAVPHGSLTFIDGRLGPQAVIIPRTRPSIRYPLTEAIAQAEGIDLWYFDPKKWPDRVPLDPAKYLGVRFAKHAKVRCPACDGLPTERGCAGVCVHPADLQPRVRSDDDV